MADNQKNGTPVRETFGEYAAQRGRQLLGQSNARQVVIRLGNGRKLLELNMTLAVVLVGLALLLPFSVLLLAILFIAGFVAKLRIEIIRNIDEDNNVIDVDQMDV